MNRHYLCGFHLNKFREIQLHGLSDTSLKAYVAVTYLRFVLIDGSIFTSLVSSKAKVIPMKSHAWSYYLVCCLQMFTFCLFQHQVVLLD